MATLSKRKADWEVVLSGLTGRYERGAPDMGRVLTAMREERLIGSRGEIENDIKKILADSHNPEAPQSSRAAAGNSLAPPTKDVQ